MDSMAESIFESMRPLTVEQLCNAPLIDFCNDSLDDKLDDYDLLSNDQWMKFEMDFPELPNVEDIFNELDGFLRNGNDNVLDNLSVLNHDCMWAGHCGGKEHADEPRSTGFIPTPPVIQKPPPVQPPQVTVEQESLLKPCVKAMSTSSSATYVQQPTVVQHSPQTPPDSDDEENKVTSATLFKLLIDDSNECDSDFNDYLNSEDVEVKVEPVDIKEEMLDIKEEPEDTESESEGQISCEELRIRTQWAAENDHSYYKDKNSAMRSTHYYGLDTPSDSEDEEIDVVSISDKFLTATRAALSLPTNPSYRDRDQLQKTMATAMSKKRGNHGIKTILPVRSGDAVASGSNTGRRGTKRGRGSRANTSYKRRRSNIEAEPTDKRHLHNDMERQRRVDLRIAFENLKAVVPEVSGTKKIAKVNILLQAAQYCYYLTGANASYMRQMEQLKRKQVWLRSRVSQLRRNLAARR